MTWLSLTTKPGVTTRAVRSSSRRTTLSVAVANGTFRSITPATYVPSAAGRRAKRRRDGEIAMMSTAAAENSLSPA
jgi:hypothetical protein